MTPGTGAVVGRSRRMGAIRDSGRMYLWLAAFLFLAWGGSPAVGAESMAGGILDGKTFVVEQGEKGKSAKGTDTLMFRNGTFRSTGCDRYGFGDGDYTTTVQGDTVRFVAETRSDTKGRMHWEGTVQGDKIDVTYTWTDKRHWYKPHPKPSEHWARGTLKKSE
jgi:hypothetical protein